MRLLVYGGSFNPPHLGHIAAVRHAAQALQPDRVLLIPAADPPHKTLPADSPDAAERLYLTQLAAAALDGAAVSDMELCRAGPSYTVDTMQTLHEQYPEAELWFLLGTDMLTQLDSWRDVRRLAGLTSFVAVSREIGEQTVLQAAAARLHRELGAHVRVLTCPALPAASSDLRVQLRQRGGREKLDEAVYARIIERRHYGARPALDWLRAQTAPMLSDARRAHVDGCEREAVCLAVRWGADPGDAAEAAILHDVTKKIDLTEQLILCRKYDIIVDAVEAESRNLLHAATAAALARTRFGASDAVCDAIRWHTTARPGMSTLEKIVFLADCIEPTRDYPGVQPLRELAYRSLDDALILALRQGLQSLQQRGIQPHPRSAEALAWLLGETEKQIT